MSKITVILFYRNYLLCSGLEHLLKNEIGVSAIFKYISFDEIDDSLHALSEKLIIVEDELLDSYKNFIAENAGLFTNSKVLLLVKSKSKNAHMDLFDGILDITSSKTELAEIINKQLRLIPARKSKNQDEKSDLSEREKTIVKLVALGKTANEIADVLFLSSHTVITHRKNISKKLGIKTVSGLTVYAILNNIVTFEEISA
ncbi:MAG TPA: hypothetical protein DDX39_03770 [Bacteroidales bacterium]|nr:MAG: hypothetical protein A2W98_12550 [Bacteroidetes bacterium GWF2_33_38]OFY74026.1 MAG: hypothetical protein A2265_02760 [Bacteroidetes bacterium RIFOXYA12_FULL_33_9]HBF87739.1 hypothetical protein [Bacteroidales bacterium]